MWVTIVVLCLATSAYARPEIIRPDEDAVELQALAQHGLEELQDFMEAEPQPDELNRKKKQITTFCVEIRSSDHKPFQVCNPYHEKEYYPKHQHQHQGGDKNIKSQSGHSGGENHIKPAFSTPVKTYVSSESSRPSKQQSFDGFQSNFPEVQNLGPARAASEDEMQIENEIPSQGAAKSNNEELKFIIDVPDVPARAAFEEDNELNEDENPSSPVRSASNDDPIPAELKKADTPVDNPIHEELNQDIGKAVKPPTEHRPSEQLREAVKPPTEHLREAVKEDVPEDIKEEVKSDIKEVKSDIKEVKEKGETQIRTAGQADAYKPKPAYDHQTQYIPYSPIHQNHHSGLVITCQPNLAGYAHRVPDPYYHQGGYHSGGHSTYNHRAADPTFAHPHYRPHAQYGGYGNYGGYKPYHSYRPQAQHYQGPAYPYPKPHYKAMPVYKPEIHKIDPYKQEHYKTPHQSYEYYPYAPGPQYPHYKPSEGFGHKTENKDEHHEHHERKADVLERVNKNDDQKSFDEETKEQHTLKKMEDISKQRLADSWVPEGMEEVFIGQPREASSVIENNVGAKSPEEEHFLSDKVDVNTAEKDQRNAESDTRAKEAEDENQNIVSIGLPENQNIHVSHEVNVKEAEDDKGLRSASLGHPESDIGHREVDNVHIHHNGDPKEIENEGRLSSSFPESQQEHFIHNNEAKEAENGGPWRSASHASPLGGYVNIHHNVDFQDAEGGWGSPNRASSGVERIHDNGEARSAENGDWRSANYPSDQIRPGHPVSDHDQPIHTTGAKSAENGDWRSAKYDSSISDHVHPSHDVHPVSDHDHTSHISVPKSAENGDWRSADYPVSDHVHPSRNDHAESDLVHSGHNGGAKSAESGGWSIVNDGDLTPNEGLREALGENMERGAASRDPIENRSSENRIEEP